MAGIYIHVPFCRVKCSYCDFYSIANSSLIPGYLEALLVEVALKKEIFSHNEIDTIYFGGGTPSILNTFQISRILEEIFKNYNIASNPEITLEANPGDLSLEFIKDIKSLNINRLSIGVQSLNEEILKFLGRKHSLETALKSVIDSKNNGIDNISIDLIYGIDGLSNTEWEKTLINALKLPVSHLSAYHLGIEENTLLYRKLKEGKINLMNDDQSFEQYIILKNISSENNFFQYEISNYAKDSRISRHNSSYWNGTEYIGLGSSAHSYYDGKRFWNVSSVKDYIIKVKFNDIFYNFEELSARDRLNERIMLGLRTVKGLNLKEIEKLFGKEKKEKILNSICEFNREFYMINQDYLCLSDKGLFMSDSIIKSLFE